MRPEEDWVHVAVVTGDDSEHHYLGRVLCRVDAEDIRGIDRDPSVVMIVVVLIHGKNFLVG